MREHAVSHVHASSSANVLLYSTLPVSRSSPLRLALIVVMIKSPAMRAEGRRGDGGGAVADAVGSGAAPEPSRWCDLPFTAQQAECDQLVQDLDVGMDDTMNTSRDTRNDAQHARSTLMPLRSRLAGNDHTWTSK